MDERTAEMILREYRENGIRNDTEEAFVFLCARAYEAGEFEKALKLCEEAEEAGFSSLARVHGDLLYYGRTGRAEPAKAAVFYREAAERHDLKALVRLSDMYRSGSGVRRDPPESFRLLEEAWTLSENCEDDTVRTDICTRLARMRKADGKTEEAVRLYLEARELLKKRIRSAGTFRDLTAMEWLVDDLRTMYTPPGKDLFDLYYELQQPARVSFLYGGKEYEAESFAEDGDMKVMFNDRVYDSPGDFVNRAEAGGTRLCRAADEISDIMIL